MSKLQKTNAGVVIFQCPGCEEPHQVTIEGDKAWGFNGDFDKPTFTPSYLTWNDPKPGVDPKHDPTGKYRSGFRCHSFITDGNIQFLDDCTHKLAGQTVMLPDEEQLDA